jgi:hypothetical protein
LALWSSRGVAAGRPRLGLKRDIVATALDIVLTAWERVRQLGSVTARSRETQIAGQLVTAMWVVLDGMTSRPQLRPEEEVGTRGPGDPAPTGRVDIKIIAGWQYHDFLHIECKRIRATRVTLAKKYVQEGVMRFVAARYAPGHEFGALVGFAIDGDDQGAASIVAQVLESYEAATLVERWAVDPSWPLGRTVYKTSHVQEGIEQQITLLHVFLPV